METEFVAYIDYKGLNTDRTNRTSFFVEVGDSVIDSILNAQKHIQTIMEAVFIDIINVLDLSYWSQWTRDLQIYKFTGWILTDDNHVSYELFNVSITQRDNQQWLREFIKVDFHSKAFIELANIT